MSCSRLLVFRTAGLPLKDCGVAQQLDPVTRSDYTTSTGARLSAGSADPRCTECRPESPLSGPSFRRGLGQAHSSHATSDSRGGPIPSRASRGTITSRNNSIAPANAVLARQINRKARRDPTSPSAGKLVGHWLGYRLARRDIDLPGRLGDIVERVVPAVEYAMCFSADDHRGGHDADRRLTRAARGGPAAPRAVPAGDGLPDRPRLPAREGVRRPVPDPRSTAASRATASSWATAASRGT